MSEPVPVQTTIQIRWRDWTALGHVNNAVYVTYFELARLAYVRALLGADTTIDRRTLLPVDFQFILAEVTCHYRSPATLGDQLAAAIWVVQMGRKSFVFEYRIHDEITGGWWPRGAARRSGTIMRRTKAGWCRQRSSRMEGLQGAPILSVRNRLRCMPTTPAGGWLVSESRPAQKVQTGCKPVDRGSRPRTAGFNRLSLAEPAVSTAAAAYDILATLTHGRS